MLIPSDYGQAITAECLKHAAEITYFEEALPATRGVLATMNGDFEQAIEHFNRTTDPGVDALLWHAIAAGELDQPDQTAELFRKAQRDLDALESDPGVYSELMERAASLISGKR